MNPTELTRYLLIGGLLLVGYLLILAWNEDHRTDERFTADDSSFENPGNEMPTRVSPAREEFESDESGADVPIVTPQQASDSLQRTRTTTSEHLVRVHTGTLNLWIDLRGGDIVKATLPGYPISLERPDVPFTLLDLTPSFIYLAQSGLTGPDGVDRVTPARPRYTVDRRVFELETNEDQLQVPLIYIDKQGVQWTKQFTFSRDAYHVDIDYIVDNPTSRALTVNAYAQIKRSRGDPPGAKPTGMGPSPYVGAAFTSEEERYQKVDFDDLETSPFELRTSGGWVAMLQHYFLTAWIPSDDGQAVFQGRAAADGTFIVGYVGSAVWIEPNETKSIRATFYAGPKIQDKLEELAPHLNLTVDYGILWWLAAPLFALLDLTHDLTGNWGAAIIILTLIVKLFLYPLSAASYRSMANMRKVAPEMKRLQERYGDDRQKFSQEIMNLYRKERINPLGGCVPMLMQMPVFLALYWVLYEAVELRQAPFIGWIQDLADLDPFFVLPLLMGASMYFQQQLNPAPPDPLQAKMLKAMPIVFTMLFLFFPAGLVLYWLVNNVLSMAQQWWITSRVERSVAKVNR